MKEEPAAFSSFLFESSFPFSVVSNGEEEIHGRLVWMGLGLHLYFPSFFRISLPFFLLFHCSFRCEWIGEGR